MRGMRRREGGGGGGGGGGPGPHMADPGQGNSPEERDISSLFSPHFPSFHKFFFQKLSPPLTWLNC